MTIVPFCPPPPTFIEKSPYLVFIIMNYTPTLPQCNSVHSHCPSFHTIILHQCPLYLQNEELHPPCLLTYPVWVGLKLTRVVCHGESSSLNLFLPNEEDPSEILNVQFYLQCPKAQQNGRIKLIPLRIDLH